MKHLIFSLVLLLIPAFLFYYTITGHGNPFNVFLVILLVAPFIGYVIFSVIKLSVGSLVSKSNLATSSFPSQFTAEEPVISYWVLLGSIGYLVFGLFSGWEFLPNPFWLIFGAPEPGFLSGLPEIFFTLFLLGILVPTLFVVKSKIKNGATLFSKQTRRPLLVFGLILLIIGAILLWKEKREDSISRIQYEKHVQDYNSVREIFIQNRSPLIGSMRGVLIENGEVRISLARDADTYFSTLEKRVEYLSPIKEDVLKIPGVKSVQFIQWINNNTPMILDLEK